MITSTLISAYYNQLATKNSNENESEEIDRDTAIQVANEISKNIFNKYDKLYEYLISTRLGELNSFILNHYFDKKAGENKDDKVSRSCTQNTADAFLSLACKLRAIQTPKNLQNELIDRNFSDFAISAAKYQIKANANHNRDWRIGKLIEELQNNNTLNVINLIFYLLCKVKLSASTKKLMWFELASEFFEQYVPELWKNCQLVYDIAIKHRLISSEIFNQGCYPLARCKKAFFLIMSRVIIDFLSAPFFADKASSFFVLDSDPTFDNLNSYFGNGKNAPNKIGEFIYGKKHNKNLKPKSLAVHKLRYTSFVVFVAYLQIEYSEVNKSKIRTFIEEIDANASISYDVWCNGINYPESEVGLIESLLKATETEPYKDNRDLSIFTETENIIKDNIKWSEVKYLLKNVNDACRGCHGKELNSIVAKNLHDLVLRCDKINIDFSKYNFSSCIRKQYTNMYGYSIHCLKSYEHSYMEVLKNDIYYAYDIEKKNYAAIKNSLKYRSKNLNTSIFNIYKSVVDTIEKYYFSKECSKKSICTERDCLRAMNNYAWHKLKEQLALDLENTNMGDECSFVKKHLDFYVTCNILNAEGKFLNEEEFLACAAVGFVEETESISAHNITTMLMTIVRKYCDEEDQTKEDHLEWCSKPCLTFGTVAILGLSPSNKKAVLEKLCHEANQVVAVNQRRVQQTLIILLNAILIQHKARLDSETAEQILDAIFNRMLYPQQMLSIAAIEKHPFLHAVLNDKFKNLQSPESKDGSFQQPFYMYLYAAECVAKAKKEKENDCILLFEKGGITFNKEFCITGISDFYYSTILLEGVSWRLSSRDAKDQLKNFNTENFENLINKCHGYWNEIDTDVATSDLLMLTWGSQLLLTTLSNLWRNDFLTKDNWNHEILLHIALLADFTQRKYNAGYQEFLEGSGNTNFWLISGALRYISLSEQLSIKPTKISFFEENSEEFRGYCKFLCKEKEAGNFRFFVMLSRLLSYTNFWDILPSNCSNIDIFSPNCSLPANLTNHFLPYDNIETFLTKLK